MHGASKWAHRLANIFLILEVEDICLLGPVKKWGGKKKVHVRFYGLPLLFYFLSTQCPASLPFPHLPPRPR